MNMHLYDELDAFALGALEPAEADRVLSHAEECPTCAVLIADRMRTVAALSSLAAPPSFREAAPNPDQHHPKFSALTKSSNRSARIAWATAAVALAACLALAIGNVQLHRNALQVPIASLVHSHFTHHALHGRGGDVKVLQALDGHWVYAVGDGLPAGARLTVAETIHGQQRVLGTVVVSNDGQFTAFWEQPPAHLDGFAVNGTDNNASQIDLRWP